MWESIKNALMSVKDATGIEIPGLPADLGSIGESATAAVQTASESAGGLIDSAAPAIEAVTGGVADVTESATAAVDAAAQSVPEIGGLIGGAQK
jgi:hypothetical protein